MHRTFWIPSAGFGPRGDIPPKIEDEPGGGREETSVKRRPPLLVDVALAMATGLFTASIGGGVLTVVSLTTGYVLLTEPDEEPEEKEKQS